MLSDYFILWHSTLHSLPRVYKTEGMPLATNDKINEIGVWARLPKWFPHLEESNDLSIVYAISVVLGLGWIALICRTFEVPTIARYKTL